jgi:hypothetical protein
MGGSVHLARRFGCAEERSLEERTAERSPGSAEKIAAAVCKDDTPVEPGTDDDGLPYLSELFGLAFVGLPVGSVMYT